MLTRRRSYDSREERGEEDDPQTDRWLPFCRPEVLKSTTTAPKKDKTARKARFVKLIKQRKKHKESNVINELLTKQNKF